MAQGTLVFGTICLATSNLWRTPTSPTDALPVIAGIILYTNELFPTRGDLESLKREMTKGTTDVLPPKGSEAEKILKSWKIKDPLPNLPFEYRLARAVRVIPVDDQSISKALKAFDKVVRYRDLPGTKYWELLFWGHGTGIHQMKTCVVCDSRTFAQIIKQSMQRNMGIRAETPEDSIGPLMNSPKIERTEMLVLSWNIKRTMSSWIWLQEEQADFMLLKKSAQNRIMENGSIIMGHDSDPSVAAVASYKHPIERWDIIPRITDPDLKRMMEYLESREEVWRQGRYRGRLVGASSSGWEKMDTHFFPCTVKNPSGCAESLFRIRSSSKKTHQRHIRPADY